MTCLLCPLPALIYAAWFRVFSFGFSSSFFDSHLATRIPVFLLAAALCVPLVLGGVSLWRRRSAGRG